MINLSPWRERALFGKKRLALSLVIMGYLLLFFVGGVFLLKLHDQKNELMHSLHLLNHEVNQFRLNTKGLLKRDASQKQVVQMRLLVGKRAQFIEKIIQLMMRLPNSVVLTQIYCAKGFCELTLAAKKVDFFASLFSNYQVQTVKQGLCPLCYQAKILDKL